MDALVNLSDEELLASARHWRAESLRGVLHARGFAHDYELEVRRRWPKPAPPTGSPVSQAAARRYFWRFERL